MKSRTLTLILFCLFLTQAAVAQVLQCGQQRAIKHQAAQLSGYKNLIDQTYENAQQVARQQSNSRSKAVLTVPVVVHIVYGSPEQNVSDDLVYSQLQVLNEDFQRLNPDASNARERYQAVAGNAEIQFVLADTDPEGNPTNGITRTQTDVSTFVDVDISFESILSAADSCGVDMANPLGILDSFACIQEVLLTTAFEENENTEGAVQMDDVKSTERGGIDPWDTERYINIWVCNLNMNFQGEETPAILGFAYPPVSAPNWPSEAYPENLKEIDGLVIHHEAFGVKNPEAGMLAGIVEKGRTCTHEMGHYFGLRHIHGDGGCSEDDGLADTPASDANVQQTDLTNLPTCADLQNLDTCTEDDLPDMYENYMDYNSEACQNLFTQEQVAIMRAMLEGPRAGLILQQLTSTVSADLNQAMTLYPNPTNGQLNIALTGYNLNDFTVEIQSVVGQTVLSIPAQSTIDVSDLAAGIYLVGLKNEGIHAVQKISIIE